MSLTNNEISQIYQGKKAISDYRAKAIERAFGLSSGWLSADHEFVYQLSPGELLAHTKLAALPSNIKLKLYALVEELGLEGPQ
jgi:DNA-binding transcriptional regulator YdaS (Cro superfamily)